MRLSSQQVETFKWLKRNGWRFQPPTKRTARFWVHLSGKTASNVYEAMALTSHWMNEARKRA